MTKLSRRALAHYGADQLLAGKSAKLVAHQLATALIDAGQVRNSDYLLADIMAELEHRRALSVARVASARPLTSALRRSLVAELKKATSVEAVILDETVDKTLIGGLRVETANRVWDMTLRRKLQMLKELGS